MWIDNCMFNGEPIIKLRLQYLFDSVDKFYICEQRYTHQGERKQNLFIDMYSSWFESYLTKIIFLIDETKYDGDSWVQENGHRNYSIPYILEQNKDNEYIISICDCDEIPDKTAVINRPHLYTECNNGAMMMTQKLFYYNLNWYLNQWKRAFFLNNKVLSQFPNVQLFRNQHGPVSGEFECGWHLSYFMNKDDIKRKLLSFAHTECCTEKFTNVDYIYECIQQGKFLFGWPSITVHKYTSFDFPLEFISFQRYIQTIQE